MKPILFLKAQSIPTNSRWITVHPNGPGSKGQPLLIQPNPDGSAHVIGGAGGKMNYLKLRAVRSESDYKKEAATKKVAATAAKAEQRKADKAAGLVESKKAAKQAVRSQVVQHERKFVQAVASSMGWEPKALEFNEEAHPDISDAAKAKLRDEHHRELLNRANGAVEVQRKRLVDDAAARMEADIGEIPLESTDPEQLSVQDLNPIKAEGGGLGFATDYKKRAEKAGLSPDDLKAESDAAKAAKQATMTPAQRQAAVARGETAKMVENEIKAIREPVLKDAKVIIADAKEAVELLKQQKMLKQLHAKARAANKEIDKSASEPKAFVIEYTADPDADEKIESDIASDLRTLKTQAFLSEFKQLAGDAPGESLGKHVGVGAYNSINSLALAVGGEALVDRSVVDVLGVAGAATVLARRIHTDLADDVQHITDGMQQFHLDHYMTTSESALSDARDLMEAAKEIELGELSSGSDLQAAQELNGRRRRMINDAQKVMGQALGEMEANSAIVVALKQGKKDTFQVSLGKMGIEGAIKQVRAIGLQRGDYTIDEVAGDKFLTVNAAGLDRLAKPVNRADVEQVRRNLSIINGDADEDGWLPRGIANRPDLAMDVKPGVAASLAIPFEPSGDLEQSLKDYIGGRAADGDTAGDIVADIQSAEFFNKTADKEAYRAALDKVAPLRGEDGKMSRADQLDGTFDQYADEFVSRRHGGTRSTLNKQKFIVDQKSVDALHRALAATPEGTAAYKQIGELTHQDQRAIREFFHRNVAKESPDAASLRADLERHTGAEPGAETTDMFGDVTANPEHTEWKSRRDELASKVNSSSLTWGKYVESMGGNEKAYEAVQDLIRSKVGRDFADAHNKLKPNEPIKVGKALIRNNLNHLDATDPEAREARLAKDRAMVDSLRERAGGKYAAGSVSDKIDAARDQAAAFEQAQMGFFADDTPDEGAKEIQVGADERHSIGHAAERQIAGMMGVVGKNFKPGQPLKLWSPSMSGGENVARQRAIKLIEANKRMGLHLGAGSGKTLVSLAAFTHLHEQGKVKRGVFVVPSIVQGQFGGEALRYLEPGKFNWACNPGASRDDRIASYKNKDNHFCVVTHQSLRDDLLHLGATAAGIPHNEMRDRINAMSHDERKEWMSGVMKSEGIEFDYTAVDEGHNLLDRQGKDDSGMSQVIGAHSANSPYYVSMTADPVRNDVSELYSALQKVDPVRYRDRAAFMRKYGADTQSSKNALNREMARSFYAHKIEPNVKTTNTSVNVPLSNLQKKSLETLDADLSALRISRMTGKTDIEAAKRISPSSFEGVPDDKHEDVAKQLQSAIGIIKESATRRIIDAHPSSAKLDEAVKQVKARNGKPGIVFAHSLDAVNALKERMEQEGIRVVTIHGGDSSDEKDRKRKMFSPDGDEEAQADVLIASDAASTGLNAQRGRYVLQYDTPSTAMTHAQRQARVRRIGQKNDVELIDLIGDHPSERKARDRLAKKYQMRDLTTSSAERLDDTGLASYLKQRATQEPQ